MANLTFLDPDGAHQPDKVFNNHTSPAQEHYLGLLQLYQCCHDSLALVVLGSFISLMYGSVEIDHPVFGVLFHEAVGLLALAAVSLCQCLLPIFDISTWSRGQILVALLGCGFHQACWMVVTILR